MGIYMYSIRAKAHKIEMPDGTVTIAREMKLLFNGGSFFTPRQSDLLLQRRAEQYWEGKTLPKYVISCGKEGPEVGDWVYQWTGTTPLWIDCDPFPGEHVAEVLSIEKSRTLRVGEHVCQAFGDMADNETGQDMCICGSSFGPNHPERTGAARLEKMAADASEQAAREDKARENWQSFVSE